MLGLPFQGALSRALPTLALLSLFAVAAEGMGAPSSTSPPRHTPVQGEANDPAARKEDLQPALEEARLALQAAASSDEAAAAPARAKLDLLRRLDVLLGQQVSLEGRRLDLETQKVAIEAERAALVDGEVPGPRPYTFQFLEGLRDQLDAELVREEGISAAAEAASAALAEAKREFETAESERRRRKEAVGRAVADRRTAEEQALALAELASDVALEQVGVRELQLAEVDLSKEQFELRTGLLREKIERVQPEVRLSKQTLGEYLDEIARERARVDSDSLLTEQQVPYLSDRAMKALERLEELGDESNTHVELEAQTRRLELEAVNCELAVFGDHKARLDIEDHVWQIRSEVAEIDPDDAGDEASKLVDWRGTAQGYLEKLERSRKLSENHLAERRSQKAEVDARMAGTQDGDREVSVELRRQSKRLGEVIAAYERELADSVGTQALVRRLLVDVSRNSAAFSVGEWLQVAGSYISKVWKTPITQVEDNSITIGKVVQGIVLLILGVWFSKFLSRYIFSRLLKRFGLGLTQNVAAAGQTLAFYAFALTFGLLALKIVNVPLTVFTLLGSALAIGVGFGSQNIVNNFISGLILIAERPIRVGDLIEVGNLFGNVISVGARSTTVRTGSNVDIIVPNSSFLESNVINWTLVDHSVRVHITVGVAYGSPVREVSKLLTKATEGHGKVLKNPEPFVLFTEFGDNSLIFELHFWTHIRRLMDRRRIESDMRFRVESLFHDAGITISFPQRDVHLDSISPVKVELVREPVETEAL